MTHSNTITDFIVQVTIDNKTTTIVDILEGEETPSEAVLRILQEEHPNLLKVMLDSDSFKVTHNG